MNHAKKPAWPPPFPCEEWSETTEQEFIEKMTRGWTHDNIQEIRTFMAECLVVCFVQTDDEEEPLAMLHGLENAAEKTFRSFDPSETAATINAMSGVTRQELASRMVWEFVWEQEASARMRAADSLVDQNPTHTHEGWEDGGEPVYADVRYTHTDKRFTPFLEKFPELRLFYEFIVRGALPTP